ncbi:extracellular solute-binding protein [Paenibacillus sp. LHD-117]|uniref:ABC transporter substrate-binding protein n=1 Tax=Paenibacillus sp. LHD-117 TaxID=3071412 RepID=UPI0027E0CF75|nr:extracellular solute-binding protein [Paenibacillus sp. LHD-117]MDQ6420009.1 extracellular solute-binding protein [Paenibacillus sp. LHD-117]
MKALKKPLVLISLILTIALAACSNNGEQPNNGQAASNTPSASPSATPTPEPEAEFDLKGEPIKIGLWWDGADPRGIAEADRTPSDELMIQKLGEVEKKYNTKIEYVKFGDYGKYVENFTTTSLAGEPFADIVVMELFWAFPTLVNKGFLQPIDEYLDMNDPKYNDWMKKGGSFGGKQYGFYDGSPSPYGFFYNKTLVEKFGLEDPYELQQKGEWTWDKMREFAKAATKDTDGDGKTDVYGIAGAYGKVNALTEQFIHTNNASIDIDANGDLKFSMDSEDSIAALQFVSDLYNVDKSIMQPQPENGGAEFIAGKGVLYGGFSWELGGLKDGLAGAGQEIGYVFIPKGPKADKHVSYTPYGNMYMLSKYSKHPEAAIRIFDEINLFEEGRKLTLKSYETSYPSKESMDTRVQMLDSIGYISFYAIPDAGTLFGNVITDITEGKVSPATAVEKVKPQFEANIKKLIDESK